MSYTVDNLLHKDTRINARTSDALGEEVAERKREMDSTFLSRRSDTKRGIMISVLQKYWPVP